MNFFVICLLYGKLLEVMICEFFEGILKSVCLWSYSIIRSFVLLTFFDRFDLYIDSLDKLFFLFWNLIFVFFF